ncbi:paxillin-like [Styela clava]
MEDLDALLQDLEATIPHQLSAKQQTSLSPNDETNNKDIILNMKSPVSDKENSINQPNNNPPTMTALQSNLSELDSLLNDLCKAEPPPQEYNTNPKKSEESIDDLLQKLQSTTPSTNDTTKASPTASSATKELDDLLASLGDFKVPEADDNRGSGSAASDKSDPPYAKPDKSRSSKPTSPKDSISTIQPTPVAQTAQVSSAVDLDSMLGQINTDLSKQGIRAASKGDCAACQKPVMGEVTTALGKVWHPEHFVCAVCDEEIGVNTFFERDQKPYCEKCYHSLFSPSCAYCNQPVLGQCVTALNKTWHPEHFFCAQCGNFFGDEGFHEYEGRAYCRKDYYNMFAPKCGGCGKPILSNYISALNFQWHPECFVCRECFAPFTNGSFFELDGKPYCETHYHLLRGSLCSGCQKPITGRCITAMGKKFHPEHFVCAFCLKQLNKGTFKEQNEKPYCHQCFQKLFSSMVLG